MTVRAVRSISVLALTYAILPSTARADSGDAAKPGDTAWGLPGIVRVGVPGLAARRVTLAGTAGYGYLESQSSSDAAHHRITGSAAVGVAPFRPLELSLRFDGRYDLHPDDGQGSHTTAVGDPRLLARFGGALGKDVRVGAELGAWFPGKDAPSVSFAATTLDARLLAAWAPERGPTVAVAAGYRLDNTAHSVDAPDRYRFGDRLALGVSDFDAALVGIGVSVPLGRSELLGELSGDLLVGKGAPSLSKSPLRADMGFRHPITDALAFQFLGEISLSGRPDIGPAEPMIPIEPRVSLLAGLRYTLPLDAPTNAGEEPPAPAAPAETKVATSATTASVAVRVTAKGGTAVETASVEIRAGDVARSAQAEGGGTYRASDVPLGDVTIHVTADGFVEADQTVNVTAVTPPVVNVELAPVPPSGQLRGLVRSFSGRGLAASIHVKPIGGEGGAEADAKADAQGAFTLDVPPGDYEVVIHADKFKDQKRKVHVDQNGVTVLNADLFEAR